MDLSINVTKQKNTEFLEPIHIQLFSLSSFLFPRLPPAELFTGYREAYSQDLMVKSCRG